MNPNNRAEKTLCARSRWWERRPRGPAGLWCVGPCVCGVRDCVKVFVAPQLWTAPQLNGPAGVGESGGDGGGEGGVIP